MMKLGPQICNSLGRFNSVKFATRDDTDCRYDLRNKSSFMTVPIDLTNFQVICLCTAL